MKRILFFSTILLVASMAMTFPKAERLGALLTWRNATHDFGRIPQSKPVTATFAFVNKGDIPLVINQAKGSCGCTGVEYTKEAILPGQSGTVKATFNAAALGAFNKSVTVESNAEGGTTVLYFRGEVVSEGAGQ